MNENQYLWTVLTVLLLAPLGRLVAEDFVRHGLAVSSAQRSREDLAWCAGWLVARRMPVDVPMAGVRT